MKALRIEVEVDEWGNYTYRDHTADRCHMSGRDSPLEVALDITGQILESMGALSEDATRTD